MQKQMMMTAAAALAACVATADTVTLTATDTGEQSSFASGLHWPNGSAPSAANDYVVANNLQMRTPNDSVLRTFAGKSLALGASDLSSKGDITLRTTRANTGMDGRLTINNLHLNKGWIAVGLDITCWLGGTTTVHSPVSDPFCYWTPATARCIETAQTFTGGEGTGLNFEGPGPMTLGGSNAGYLGSWVFDNTKITLNNKDALGGVLSSTDAASIALTNGAQLVFSTGVVVPATRGIMLDANGSTFTINNTSTVLAPIRGGGSLTVNGGATLRYGGSFSAAGIILNGKLSLTNGFAMASTSTVTLNSFATLEVAVPDFRPTVYNFTGNGGMLLVNVDAAGGSCVDFRGSFALNQPLAICLNGLAYTNRLAVATIPVASRIVTADDFTLSDVWYGLGMEGIEVETDEGSGLQTVYLKTIPYVHAVAGAPALCRTATHWSDGQIVHAGRHYVVQGRDLRYGGADGIDYTFEGDSLTLFNPYTNIDATKQYVIKQTTFTCNDLRGYDYGGIAFGGGNAAGTEQTLAGRLSVKTATSAYFRFNGGAFRTNRVAAVISGDGRLFCMGQTTYKFLADNSAYSGSIHVNGYKEGEILGLATFVVTNECNLGGNPASFTADAFAVQTRGIFRPGASMTIDDANRGMTLESGGQVFVDAHVTLATRVSMTWVGTSSKDGPGIWDLGGTASAASSNPLLVVSNGTLRAGSARPLVGVSLTFADGANYAIGYVADPMDERATYGLVVNKTLVVAGDALPVAVDLPDPAQAVITQPLFTVPTAAADALAAKLAVAKPKNTRCDILKTATTFNSEPMTTLSVRFTKLGLMVLVL